MLNRKMVFPWNIDNPTFEDEWLAVSCIGTCVIEFGEKGMNDDPQYDFTSDDNKRWKFTGEIRAPKQGEYYTPAHNKGVVKCGCTWTDGRRPIVVPVEEWSDWSLVHIFNPGDRAEYKAKWVSENQLNVYVRTKQ